MHIQKFFIHFLCNTFSKLCNSDEFSFSLRNLTSAVHRNKLENFSLGKIFSEKLFVDYKKGEKSSPTFLWNNFF